MVIKIKLKNVDRHVLLDHEVYETLRSLPLFRDYDIFENLRQHSSGVPVFQKYLETVNDKMKIESIYLALFIAKKFIPVPDTSKKMYLNFENGDKLDLRLKNLRWIPMSQLSRNRVTKHNKTGFRGVRQTPQGKFVAMIFNGIKQVYLGTFESAREAALAYNKKSIELFGISDNLNQVDRDGNPIPYEVSEELKQKKRHRRRKYIQTNAVSIDSVSLKPARFQKLSKRGRKSNSNNGRSSSNVTIEPGNGDYSGHEENSGSQVIT